MYDKRARRKNLHIRICRVHAIYVLNCSILEFPVFNNSTRFNNLCFNFVCINNQIKKIKKTTKLIDFHADEPHSLMSLEDRNTT